MDKMIFLINNVVCDVWCVVRRDFHRKQFCKYFAIEMTKSSNLPVCSHLLRFARKFSHGVMPHPVILSKI